MGNHQSFSNFAQLDQTTTTTTQPQLDPSSIIGKMRSLFSNGGSVHRSAKSFPPSSTHGPSSSPAHTPTPTPTPSCSAPPSSSDEMERVFRKFDADGDGRISRSDLAAIFESVGQPASDDEVGLIMEEGDANADGYISMAEFAAINAAPPAAVAVEEDLRQAFAVFDANGNGVICPSELASVLRGLGEASTASQCLCMIQGVDHNGDGLVSFDEFKLMMATGGGGVGNIRA